jgi:hypothetical protein
MHVGQSRIDKTAVSPKFWLLFRAAAHRTEVGDAPFDPRAAALDQ